MDRKLRIIAYAVVVYIFRGRTFVNSESAWKILPTRLVKRNGRPEKKIAIDNGIRQDDENGCRFEGQRKETWI